MDFGISLSGVKTKMINYEKVFSIISNNRACSFQFIMGKNLIRENTNPIKF